MIKVGKMNWNMYRNMQDIEKELCHDCFYPERENLSESAIHLLISSRNGCEYSSKEIS